MNENITFNREDQVESILYPGDNTSERELNRQLLKDYEYEKYVEGLTGYAGQNLQQISKISSHKAQRTRIGARGHYKAGMTVRKDGSLIAAPCVAIRGEGPYDVTFKIKVYESKDKGLTWIQINKTELDGKEPTMICLEDGTLLLTAQPIVDGKMGYRLPVYRSIDNGITWCTTYIEGNRDYPRNIFVDRDNSVCFMRCSAVKFEFEEAQVGDGEATIEINRSYDGGLTWQQSKGKIIDWDYPGFMEVSSQRLPSGKLVATLRHQPSGTKGEGFENTLITYSEDEGVTWSKPLVISNTGEVHFNLLLLKDGRLLGTYSNYHLPYGVYSKVSNDEGATWSSEKYLLAYSADYYLGWGVTCETEDSSLMTVYASTPYLCEPPDTTVCEAVKWSL